MKDEDVYDLLFKTRTNWQRNKAKGNRQPTNEVLDSLLNLGIKPEQMLKVLKEIQKKEGWEL